MPAYITSLGKFLPGDPIPVAEVEDYIGAVGSSQVRDVVIKNSGIQTRHYAIDREQKTVMSNLEIASSAIRQAVGASDIALDDVDLLAVATSAGDYFSPALANMVHGELMDHPCEVVSNNGLCACGMMAMKAAYHGVASGEHRTAVACGSELVSRQFKSARYANGQGLDESGNLPFDVAFLRYMLSDGAGAVVIQDRPAPQGLSYRIEWITLTSYAHTTDPCMYLGSNGQNGKCYQDYPTLVEAALDGAMSLRQNMKLLPRLIKMCAKEWKRLVDAGMFDPDAITRVVFHYSSEALRDPFRRAFEREGIDILADRWFVNLPRVGNIGCAAAYVLLAELHETGTLGAGDQVLCFVPESGRFSAAHMLLTVVEPDA
jgi:3-oxoacyl-[acyl-carrier-protein] synthase III